VKYEEGIDSALLWLEQASPVRLELKTMLRYEGLDFQVSRMEHIEGAFFVYLKHGEETLYRFLCERASTDDVNMSLFTRVWGCLDCGFVDFIYKGFSVAKPPLKIFGSLTEKVSWGVNLIPEISLHVAWSC